MRVGAVGAADGVLRVRELGDFALERLDGVAKDEQLGVDDAHDRGDDFVADRRVLRAQIQQWNGHSSRRRVRA